MSSPHVRERADHLAHLKGALGVEPVRRLVEYNYPRLTDQRERDPYSLPHPEREVADLVVDAFREADLVEDLADLGVFHGNAGRSNADSEVLERAYRFVDRRCLDDRSDTAHRLTETVRPWLVTVDSYCALCRPLQPEEHSHRRALTSAVGAKEPDDRAFRHVERQIVENGALAESLHEPVELDR